MSFAQMESFIDSRYKNGRFRNRKSLAIAAALLLGTALACTLLFGGSFSHHALYTRDVAPPETSLQVRPDYPVSSFLYERGVFKWFLTVGLAVTIGAGFASLGPACIVTGPIGTAGCVLGAVAAVGALVGAIKSSLDGRVQDRRLHLAQMSMLYMDYVDKSSRREIDPAQDFLDNVFGPTYRFAGNITKEDDFNAHLVERNNGEDVPVFSYTTPRGMKFHHIMIHNKEDGTMFHRFGFDNDNAEPAGPARLTKRHKKSYGKTQEHFKHGGLDVLDCATSNGNKQYLKESDHPQMEKSIQCADPNFRKNTELNLQVLDKTTKETIGLGRIAPVKADGKSRLTEKNYHKCAAGLTKGEHCAVHTAHD